MDDLIESAISRIVEALGAGPHSLHHVELALRQVAAEAAKIGGELALLSLRTTAQAAVELGITERMVQAHAQHHSIGWKVAPGQYLFRPEDIEAMRARRGNVGQPRKVQDGTHT